MGYKNRNVQNSIHLECCSPSLRTILGSRAKCSAGKHNRQPWGGQRKSPSCRMVGQSLSVHQTGEMWFHRNTSSASLKSSVTLSWFFVVVFIGSFVVVVVFWSFLFVSLFLCFLCLLEILCL